MRALVVSLVLGAMSLFAGGAHAADRETYRGFSLDLSSLAGRKDLPAMTDALHHQLDLVDGVTGLSPRVQEFFRTIPISVSEVACLNATQDNNGKDIEDPKALLHPACYGMALPENARSPAYGSVWDSGRSRWINDDPVALGLDTNRGVIMVRPILLAAASPFAERPAMLHELLHAYHNLVLPRGFKNPGILLHYGRAKEGKLYPDDSYFMANAKEYFAVTASVFLTGKDGPLARSLIKEKQPDYYKYLVYLFGFDPEPDVAPMASAD